MNRRPSLFRKIWRKLRGAKPAAPTPLPPRDAEPQPKRASSLEPLEGRIAPAALINPTTLVYKDIDGDIVTVKFSKELFKGAGDVATLANQVFKFDTGNVIGNGFTAFDPATAVAQQLQLIDLTKAPLSATVGNVAQGTGFTITAVKGALNDGPGDGSAHVGYVKATGLALGAVSIAGDLGQIDAGTASVKTAIASLKVQSLGAKGLTTQGTTGASLESNIVGGLGSLTVAGDVREASVRVVNGSNFQGTVTAPARIGAITIGGSLIGAEAAGAASDSTGLIQSQGEIGAVRIGTTAAQGIVGGGGQNSGSILAAGKIASVLVSGDVSGGAGAGSGVIQAGTSLGATTIKGSLKGAGANSGIVQGGSIASITLGGSIIAGTGAESGIVAASFGSIGIIKIGGDIDATTNEAGAGAGGIDAYGKIASVTVTGALKGGVGAQSGFIKGGWDIGAVTLHDIVGGAGKNAGTVLASGKIASIGIAGNVLGGSGAGSGSVFGGFDAAFAGDIGAVKIGGRIEGGSGVSSAVISSTGKIASVTIGPAKAVDQVLLKGGAGDWSGAIFSRGGMGAVKIMGHIEGGGGDFSGAIVARDLINFATDRAGDIAAVTVAGRVQGGTGDYSGIISSDGKLASATIGSLIGGDGDRSGTVRAGQGLLSAGNTGAIAIKGALTGGAGDQSGGVVAEGKIASITVDLSASGGTIRAGDDIGALTFKQNVDGTKVSARGQAVQGATKDVAIGAITVGGNVANAQFLAGYDTALTASNPDAQIGTVIVKGNWTASDLVAGVLDAGAAGFGDAGDVAIPGLDNAKIVSSIASIVITGSVSGTPGIDGDHFGFTAQKIGAFKAAGVATPQPPLNALADGQFFDAVTDEVTVREIPLQAPV
jgi:hypothetical protein